MNADTLIFFNTIHTFKMRVTGCLCLLDADSNFPHLSGEHASNIFKVRGLCNKVCEVIPTCTVVVVATGLGESKTCLPSWGTGRKKYWALISTDNRLFHLQMVALISFCIINTQNTAITFY